MLADKKHIKEIYIHNVVRNMKDKLREVLGNNRHTTRYSKNTNEVLTYQNEGKNFNAMEMKKKISSFVDYIFNVE